MQENSVPYFEVINPQRKPQKNQFFLFFSISDAQQRKRWYTDENSPKYRSDMVNRKVLEARSKIDACKINANVNPAAERFNKKEIPNPEVVFRFLLSFHPIDYKTFIYLSIISATRTL